MSSRNLNNTLSGTHTRELVSLFPTKELNFTLQNGIYLAKLAISNVILQPVLYKIKITATRYYHVHPIAGKLMPGEQITIHVKMPYPEDPEARFDDKFLVQAFIPGDHYLPDDVQEVMDEFKHQMPQADNVQQAKLKVYYDISQHHSPTVKKLKSPHSRGSSVKQVTWKSDLEKEDAMMVGIRTASTVNIKDNSLKNEENNNLSVNSVLNLNNIQDNSLQIFTPQKQTEQKKNSFELNNSSGSITFRRVNLKSGTKKKRIEDEIKESMSRGMQRADMTEALIPSKKWSAETRNNTSKVLILEDDNKSVSKSNISQGLLSDVSAATASRRGLILKQKCMQLESKYKTQQVELEALINEKDEYINQLNKLKHIFGDVSFEDPAPELTKKPSTAKGSKMRFEAWQLMLVSVGCLILGSGLNTTDYCLAFAKGADFTDLQTQNCFKCLQSNNSIDYTLNSDFSLDSINPNATRDSLFHAVYPKDPVGAECQPYVRSLQAIYSANKTADELFKIITENSNKYFVDLMMDFATWRVRLVENDGSKFGSEEAHILGYVTGVTVPKEVEWDGQDSKSPKIIKRFLAN